MYSCILDWDFSLSLYSLEVQQGNVLMVGVRDVSFVRSLYQRKG